MFVSTGSATAYGHVIEEGRIRVGNVLVTPGTVAVCAYRAAADPRRRPGAQYPAVEKTSWCGYGWATTARAAHGTIVDFPYHNDPASGPIRTTSTVQAKINMLMVDN